MYLKRIGQKIKLYYEWRQKKIASLWLILMYTKHEFFFLCIFKICNEVRYTYPWWNYYCSKQINILITITSQLLSFVMVKHLKFTLLAIVNIHYTVNSRPHAVRSSLNLLIIKSLCPLTYISTVAPILITFLF
jgi:hypothetical protein